MTSPSQTSVNSEVHPPVHKSQPSPDISRINSCAITIFREAQRMARMYGGDRRQLTDVQMVVEKTKEALNKKESSCPKLGDDVLRAFSIAGMLAPKQDQTTRERKAANTDDFAIQDVRYKKGRCEEASQDRQICERLSRVLTKHIVFDLLV